MLGGGAGAESLCLVMLPTLSVWKSGCACEALALITPCESPMMEKWFSLALRRSFTQEEKFSSCANQRRVQILGREVRRSPREAEFTQKKSEQRKGFLAEG